MAWTVKSRRARSSREGRAETHDGQSSRTRVRLGTRRGDVERPAVGRAQGRGAEALVDPDRRPEPAGEPPGKADRVALDDEVEVADRPSEEQVAHGAADDVDRRVAPPRGAGFANRATQAGRQPRPRRAEMGRWRPGR